MKMLDTLARVLLIVGGLNWGLFGAAKFDLVATLFGAGTALSSVVNILVDVSALVQLIMLARPSKSTAVASSR